MKYNINFNIEFKTHSYPGKLIALEGIDGSGKTSQVEKVGKILSASNTVFTTKNPTDGEIGKFIRRILGGEIKIPAACFQYLFSADRQVQQVEIIERLKKGEYIITDRYFWSALAYGIVDRIKEDPNLVGKHLLVAQSILSHYYQFIVPDITFYLDISVDTSLKRINAMRKKREIYENKEHLTQIHKSYEWLLKEFPNEFTKINAEGEKEEVTKILLDYIRSLKK